MKKFDLRGVILAGGRGTRFWPLGRERRPKQLLKIISSRSMLEETVRRIRPIIPLRKIELVSDEKLVREIGVIFPAIKQAGFLVEPSARNTAPAIMLAMAKIWVENPEAVAVILPSDHLIVDKPRFRSLIKAAAAAACKGNALITFGIPPTYPATGYGYIHLDKNRSMKFSGENFYRVKRFKEKPSLPQARKFLASGNYYWNSGIFVWQAVVFADELARADSSLFGLWQNMCEALKKKDRPALRRLYLATPAISVDYALMEKAGRVLAAPGDFGWSDIGSWSSLFQVWKRDENGNAVNGEAIILDSKNCLVYNPEKLTSLIGASNLIVVETEDVLLICENSSDQKVKQVVEKLKANGKTHLI